MRLLPLILAALLALPAFAQAAGDSSPDEAELRAWHQNLSKEQREQLKHRQRVFKRMDKDSQKQALENAGAGRPILSAAERESLEQLRTMGYLKRARLFTLANELQVLRRTGGPEFKRAMEMQGDDRVRELHMLLQRRRAMAFLRTLPESEQQKLNALPPGQRLREAMQLYERENRARRDRLERAFPHVAELREKARSDEAARTELRRVMADLWTLDMMLQRLLPDARDRVLAQLPNLDIDKSAELLRKELQAQWQAEMRQHKRNPAPRSGEFAPANRAALPNDRRRRE